MDQMTALIEELNRRAPQLELREYEPMSRHTTFRIGGPARLMALPASRKEAVAAVRAARELGISPFFLGNGSDLLVSDQGFDGFIVKTTGLDQTRVVNRRLRAESGIPLARLAMAAWGQGLTGLEFAHGIPGTLGGGVTMNAGAYGGELVQVLTSVTFLNDAGEVVTLPVEECALTYRHSLFTDHPEWLILEAEFELAQGVPSLIKIKMDELAQKRRSKQPLDLPSAGSTFKRDDVRRLMELVQNTVRRETGVTLEPEVKFLGF